MAALLFVGCEKKDSANEADPASRMRDKAYVSTLAEHREKMKRARVASVAVGRRMAELVEDARRRLGTDDPDKIQAALANVPEWQRLEARRREAEAAVEAERQAALETVRRRTTPKSLSK